MRARHRAAASVAGWLGTVLLAPVGVALAYLPTRVGLWAGRQLGMVAWVCLRRRRAVVLENLTRAFGPSGGDAGLGRLARGSFEHLGMNFVEACVFFFRAPSVLLSRVEICGESHLEAAAGRGRGVLLLTAHYGNWELLAASRALTAHELSVVIRPLDHPLLDRVVARFRERSGVELITRHRGLREILDALRRGRLVGILLDQNVSRGQGVFVPFFGIPASTSKSLAVISLRTGAPVVPVFIRRRPDGRHRVEIDAALPVPPDGDVVAYTASFNRAIEAAIRQAPEQWFWLHRRWKTRPQEGSL